MNTHDFLYSIIIPHRNSIDLLQRLINTIPQRRDIQVLIIDNSVVDIDFRVITEKKSNIEILFSDKTKGAGHARNIGLESAKGKWVIFSDADDFFTRDAFDSFDKYENEDIDIVYFGVESRNSNTYEYANRSKFYDDLVNNFYLNENHENENKLRLKHIVPWGKMISHSLIFENKIKFDEVPASNDVMFSTKIGLMAKEVFVNTNIVYCVTVSKGSLTQKPTKDRNFSRYNVALEYNKLLKEKNYSDYQISVMIYIKKSLDYGFTEFLKYIKVACSYNVNVISLWLKTKKER